MQAFSISDTIQQHIQTAERLLALQGDIQHICDVCLQAISQGHKIILAGNGGSAADAQHIAAEFVGRFVKERAALPALALTVDTSALTAIGNDYGFEHVFARQLAGLGQKGDVFIGISTSGNSANIARAFDVAAEKGITRLLWTGRDGGALKHTCEHALIVPSDITAHIQEMHILIGHIVCGWGRDLG